MKQQIQKVFRHFGYEVHRIRRNASPGPRTQFTGSLSVDPVWPLARDKNGLSDQQIRDEFAKFDSWHFAYEFEGGLSFPSRFDKGQTPSEPRRPHQRFRHIMPYLLEAQKGSLQGKRVLDIGCNSGFWSLQCALLGAEVVGFDGRPGLIEQANLIKCIVGLHNVTFKVLDFWDMSPQSLGGSFDVVLMLGILYHLPRTVEALQLVRSMSRDCILLDTAVYRSYDSVVKLLWEGSDDIRNTVRPGIVAVPSKSSVELILKEIGVAEWLEIPLRTVDMPEDYRDHRRASWLIRV